MVDKHIRGRAGEIKEHSLGVEVFDKGEDFDPRLDPIVRVGASRLRNRPKHYCEDEGKATAIRIELPRGGYVLGILEGGAVDAPSEKASELRLPAKGAAAANSQLSRLLPWAKLLCAALLAGVESWTLLRDRPGRSEGGAYTFTRITREPARCNFPHFSPDGALLVYRRRKAGNWDLFLRPLAGEEARN